MAEDPLFDGRVGWALLLVFILIPIALWGVALTLSFVQVLFLVPIAFVTRRMREFREFTSFQLAVADQLGVDRLNLRQGKLLLRMFEELPPPAQGEPPRSGAELVDLYEELHADEPDGEPDDSREPGAD